MTDVSALRRRLAAHGLTLEAGEQVAHGYTARWCVTGLEHGPAWFGTLESVAGWVEKFVPEETAMYRPNEIITGDARELAATLPDSSVDLIFTDPVYQNIDDYAWLAETAMRVLSERGRVLVWCSKPKLGRCQLAMEAAGLEYVYTLDYTVQAKTFRMRWYNLFCWTTPCLWFQRPGKATRPRRWIPDTFIDTIVLDDEAVAVRAVLSDTFISTAGPSGDYVWNKNLNVLRAWLDVFSAPGETVFDPFTGSGSVPLVCRDLGRTFYASEIQPDVAEKARARLASTPARLTDSTRENAPTTQQEPFSAIEPMEAA